jgi:hypothetical protein
MSLPKKKKGRRETALLTQTPSSQRCQSSVLFETPLARWMRPQKSAQRRCVVCNAPVTNSNLGGYDGRSALAASLYCIHCAELRKP